MQALQFNDAIETFTRRITRARQRITRLLSLKSDALISDFGYRKSWPTDQEINRLIELTYYASMELDELRPSRFSICWIHPCLDRELLTFESPIEMTSSSVIAKLSHATQTGTMLVVSVVDDRLQISGIASSETQWSGGFEFPGILIIVRNPGVLEYYEGGYSLAYSRGTIRRIRALSKVLVVSSYLCRLEARQLEKTKAILCEPRRSFHSDALIVEEPAEIERLSKMAAIAGRIQLCKIIEAIGSQSHGGMIAIAGSTQNSLHIKYPVKATEFDEVLKFCSMAFALLRQTIPSFGDEGSFLNPMWHPLGPEKLMSFLASIGTLGSIDGCLVLDADLRVLGFGAVVAGTDDESNLPIENERGHRLEAGEVLRLRGTRHRAAIRFCNANSDSMAIVISQDGDIRLFARLERSILFVDNLANG